MAISLKKRTHVIRYERNSDNVLLASNQKLMFRDSGLYIYSSADGKLVIASDGTGADDLTISGTVTMSNDVVMSGNLTVNGDFTFGDAATDSLTVNGILKVGDIDAVDGSHALNIANSTGVVTFAAAPKVDTINEKTSAAGVTIDSVLLKDNVVKATSAQITNLLANDATACATIADSTGVMSMSKNLDNAASILVNTISEHTSAAGVTIDSVLLKDNVVKATSAQITNLLANDATACATIADSTGVMSMSKNLDNAAAILVDTISEHTGAAGVTIDGVKCKDSKIYIAGLYEATGVQQFATIDGAGGPPFTNAVMNVVGNNSIKFRDSALVIYSGADGQLDLGADVKIVATVPTFEVSGAVSVDTISEKTSAAGVTIDGMQIKDSQPYCDVINEKTSAAGVTIDSVLLKDNVVKATSAQITNLLANDATACATIADSTGVMSMSKNLDNAAAILVDTISEHTGAAGVTIDGMQIKDSVPYCDSISEKTGAAGVTIDGMQIKDSQPYCDVINEKTGAAGVTIDSVLLKDNVVKATSAQITNLLANDATACATIADSTGVMSMSKNLDNAAAILVDTISEHTGAAGVTIDGMQIKDSQPYCDVINEKTGAAGVTIDSVLLKDNVVKATSAQITNLLANDATACATIADSTGVMSMSKNLDNAAAILVDTISEHTGAAGVTIDGMQIKDSQPYCDVINEKTGAAGVTIDSVLLKDNVVKATSAQVTNLQANDGAASIIITNTTGAMTLQAAVDANDKQISNLYLGNLLQFEYFENPPAASAMKRTFLVPYDGKLVKIGAKLATCGDGGGPFVIDVNKNGVTVFTDQNHRPSIAHDEADGTFEFAATIDVTALTAGDSLTLDYDSVNNNSIDSMVIIVMAVDSI